MAWLLLGENQFTMTVMVTGAGFVTTPEPDGVTVTM